MAFKSRRDGKTFQRLCQLPGPEVKRDNDCDKNEIDEIALIRI